MPVLTQRGLEHPDAHVGLDEYSTMADIVVSLREDTELYLETIDIGTKEDGEVLAFTIGGVVQGLDSDHLKQFIGKSVVPTEIRFHIDGE